MNIPLLTELVSLRYRLLWANVRSHNGRIFLFLAGTLLLSVFGALVLFGGIAGASVVARSGHAERMAQGALSVLFFQAILVANLLGAGMSEVFSETELRRYPLTALERLIARHAIAILDPFWFLYLAFYLGLALGLSVFGSGVFLQATVTAVLLFLCNYVAARVAALAVDRLIARRSGTEILIVGAMATIAGIAFAIRAMLADGPQILVLYPWFAYSPAFAAAEAMTQSGLSGPLVVLTWLSGFISALVWIERHPQRQNRSQAGGIVWDTFFDRVGERFGPQSGPLVAFWLRFNCRNTITRRFMWLSLPMFAFLTFVLYKAGQNANPQGLFVTGLGALPLAAFMASGRIVLNQFGFMGGGLRRLLLLPVPPSFLVWSSSGVSTLLSLVFLLLCLPGWVIVAPFPFDVRMIAMLACSGLTGVFFLQAASVWATIYNPSRGNYFLKLGNDLSLGANAVVLLGTAGPIFVPGIVNIAWPDATSLKSWWTLLPLPVVATAIYLGTLALAGRSFAGRREKLLAGGRQELAMTAIRITNLVKSYRSTLAVDGLSLAVPSGTIFGFLGPNGSGKSTTIGCFTGLLTPDRGQIEILGLRLADDEVGLKRRIGVMPETLGLFEPLYAHEYLAFVARMFGVEKLTAHRRVVDLLEALELNDASKRLSEYSAGMRKRLAFAAAVIHSPDILFLDEPFESIDPAGVALMKRWLRQFADQGRTVFITSHMLETVERICSEVAIVVPPGKLVWQGDITAFEGKGVVRHDDRDFISLEDLFLYLTGQRQTVIEWL